MIWFNLPYCILLYLKRIMSYSLLYHIILNLDPSCIFKSNWSEHMKLKSNWHTKVFQTNPKTVLIPCMLVFHRFMWLGASPSQLCVWHMPALHQPAARNLLCKWFFSFSGWGLGNWVVSKPSSKAQHVKGFFLVPLTSEWCFPFSKAMTGFLGRLSPNSGYLICCGSNSNDNLGPTENYC